MIIDSHLHLPGRKEGKTLLDSRQELLRELERCKVDCAIVIPDSVPISEIGSLDEVLDLVETDKRLFVMGTINIRKDKASHIAKLDHLFETRKIVAIKIFPGWEPVYPTDKRLAPVYELCLKHDLPIVMHTGGRKQGKYNDPKYIVKIADKYPNLKIVIAHYFFPRVEYCHEITRPYENIYFDTSGLADEEVIAITGLQKIRDTLALTAEERPRGIIFGSDYAQSSIEKHIALVESLKLSKETKEMIFFKNALQLFKLRLRCA
jgi:hypothetical protein